MNSKRSVVSTAGRHDTVRRRIDREGAVALGLRQLHRQLAHDLRRPLNSISLHAALLGRAARGDLAGVDDPQAKQAGWVRAIEEDVARMASDLDRWSKLLTGGGASGEAPERVDLCGVVSELSGALAPVAARQGVELETRIPQAEVVVEGARHELVRLLASLAGASLETLDGGARLRLELRCDGATADAATATVEASAEEPEDACRTPAEGSLVPAVIGALASTVEAAGGRLAPAGRIGWRAAWPVAKPEPEEPTDDD